MTFDDVKLITLPKILDERGNLSFFQNEDQIPFSIQRAYWIYDVPGGEHRGGHAYKDLQEVIIALSGSFDVVIDDGKNKKVITLNRSYNALYIPKLVWRKLENFSTNSLAFIVCDKQYDAEQYIRDYDEYLKVKTNG
ncbi:MAG: WxcM-like domain-containing protein [Bacteroidetes bacterium]|nr:WxcM-like domain-containing protein [Bacteroidota bacterium]